MPFLVLAHLTRHESLGSITMHDLAGVPRTENRSDEALRVRAAPREREAHRVRQGTQHRDTAHHGLLNALDDVLKGTTRSDEGRLA